MENKPVDLVMQYEKYHVIAKAVALSGLRKYAETNDYKLLKEFSPELASLLINPKIKLILGAAPLAQIATISGIAWGEAYHYSSYNGAKIVDTRLKIPFKTNPTVFWFNPTHHRAGETGTCSIETLRAFLSIFKAENLSIVNLDDTSSMRNLIKSSAEQALHDAVGGWKGVYSSLQSCSDESINTLIEKRYFEINPVFTKIKTGKEETTILLGYIVSRETVYFLPEPLGKRAADREKFKKRRRKKRIILGITIPTCVLVVMVASILLFPNLYSQLFHFLQSILHL